MNCDTITIPRDEAIEKLDAYERAAKDNPGHVTAQDRAIMRALKVGKRGGRLIDVNHALSAGGVNLAGYPQLAIARAHVSSCLWEPGFSGSTAGGGWYYYGTDRQASRNDFTSHPQWTDRVIWRVPNGTYPDAKRINRPVRAMLPLIPLPLRPNDQLKNYFVLWEANWHPEPPRDPYLLRPLTGSLMEIVSEWDVSDIELAAVRQTTID